MANERQIVLAGRSNIPSDQSVFEQRNQTSASSFRRSVDAHSLKIAGLFFVNDRPRSSCKVAGALFFFAALETTAEISE